MITNRIACTNSRHGAKQFYPYSNAKDIHWPVVDLFIESSELQGLAKFLADNICNTTRCRGSLRTSIYDGKTQTEYLSGNDRGSIQKAFDTDAHAARIDDYDFPLIEDKESITEYWERVAFNLRSIGAEMVRITYAGWDKPRIYFVMEPPISHEEKLFRTCCTINKYERVPLKDVMRLDPEFVHWSAVNITSHWHMKWKHACQEAIERGQ